MTKPLNTKGIKPEVKNVLTGSKNKPVGKKIKIEMQSWIRRKISDNKMTKIVPL